MMTDDHDTSFHVDSLKTGRTYNQVLLGERQRIPDASNKLNPDFQTPNVHLTTETQAERRSVSFGRENSRVAPAGQSPRQERRGWFSVFSPDTMLRNGWDVIYDILILYSLCTTTYYLAFGYPSTGLFVFDVIVWVFFVLDVFVTLNTAFEDENGKLVMSRKDICRRYICTWFFIDVIALLPFSYGGLTAVEYYLRLVRFLRLPDTVNFVDGTGIGAIFTVIFDQLPDIQIGDFRVSYYYVSLILQQVSRVILLSYFLAALFYWYARLTGPEHVYTNLWFDDSANLNGQSSDIRFLKAWYFMLTTLATIGYGEILPVSFCEKILMIVILAIGIANFSLMMGGFISLVTELNEMNSESDLVGSASNWMDSLEGAGHKITPLMKNKVITYFSHYASLDRLGSLAIAWWNADSLEALTTPSDELYSNLPEEEQQGIISYLYSEIFYRYRHFFGYGKCGFSTDICFHFQPRVFSSGELILEQGSEVTDVFLLLKGAVSVEFSVNGEHHQFITFEDKLVIGDYCALAGVASKLSYRAIGGFLSEYIAIPVQPFLDILTGKYATPDENGYVHKTDLFKRSAIFITSLRKMMKEYQAKHGIEKMTMRSLTLQPAPTLPDAIVSQDPAKVYQSMMVQYTAAERHLDRLIANCHVKKSLKARFRKTKTDDGPAPENADQSLAPENSERSFIAD